MTEANSPEEGAPSDDALSVSTPIKNQTEYDETLWAAREAERDRWLEAKLKRQAHRLGYELVPIDHKPAA